MTSSSLVVSSSRADDDHARGAPWPPSTRSSSSSPTATSIPRRRRFPREAGNWNTTAAVLVVDVDVIISLADTDRPTRRCRPRCACADWSPMINFPVQYARNLFNVRRKRQAPTACYSVTVSHQTIRLCWPKPVKTQLHLDTKLYRYSKNEWTDLTTIFVAHFSSLLFFFFPIFLKAVAWVCYCNMVIWVWWDQSLVD